MIATGEDELICDMAETYHVLDYRALPVKLLATLACGLRPNSRSMLKLAGENVPLETLLLASMADRLAWLQWERTKDGQKNINRPKNIAPQLWNGPQESKGKHAAFNTPAEFEAARAKALRKAVKT